MPKDLISVGYISGLECTYWDMSQNQGWNLMWFFKPKINPKLFY